MKHKSMMGKVAKRLAWELYVARTAGQRLIWDALSIIDRSDERDWRVYSNTRPPLLSSDPILIGTSDECKLRFTTQQYEYLYRVPGPLTIEPQYGYVIREPLRLLDKSLPGCELMRSRKTMHFFSGLPSPLSIMNRKRQGAPTRKERAVVSMLHPFATNYFHAYQSVLSRFKILDECEIDLAIPLVVSADAWSQPFFRELAGRGKLARRNWLVQDGFYIDADEVILTRSSEGNRENLDYLLDLIDAPAPDPTKKRRIFLTRHPEYGRYVNNLDELSDVLQEFDFEVVMTGKMPIEEQMRLFSEAGFVVGVHGAGLTNIIYRRGAPMKLLEILTPGHTPAFHVMAKAYGYSYDYIASGNPNDQTRYSPFRLDPELLRARLSETLSNCPCL